MAKTSAEIAIELRSKFEFYLLALVFSILGLSIQTANFGDYLIADSFELTGWLALFVSGVIGVLRAEWIPVAYDIQAKIVTMRRRSDKVAVGLQQGQQIPVTFEDEDKETVLAGAQAIERLDAIVTNLENQHDATGKKIVCRYNRMKWAFMIGIGCLLIARGFPPAVMLVNRFATL